MEREELTQLVSSDIRIDPQNDIKIDPPPKGTKERHLTCRPGTAGRLWRGKACQMVLQFPLQGGVDEALGYDLHRFVEMSLR